MRLVSYKIQFGRGKDGQNDLERIARTVDGADIIAMQEVERFWRRSGMIDQVAELVRLLPEYHWVYGPGIDLDPGGGRDLGRRRQFGNMLMTRVPILSSRNHLLPKFGLPNQLSLQRSALEGVVELPAGPLRLYSVHLAHISSLQRRKQVGRLLEILASAPAEGGAWSGAGDKPDWAGEGPPPPMPRTEILLGDFNMEPGTPEYQMMVGPNPDAHGPMTTIDRLVDAWLAAGGDPNEGATSLARRGPRRIDYAFVSTALADRVSAARVDDEADGSDHQPLWIDMDLETALTPDARAV